MNQQPSQNYPYMPPQGQQPGGQRNQSSIGNLDENVAALLAAVIPVAMSMISHLGFAAWVVPLVIFLLEKRSLFVRLIAAQSLAVSIVIFLCAVIRDNLDRFADTSHFLTALPVGIFGLLLSLMQVACLVLLVLTAINAYRMVVFEIPSVTQWLRKNVGQHF
ncbi:MAG: DUF4870 domain-containing protein [Clostridia bacterium]|jgi:uncharacterized membrane protein|nr:DUF4870 domain-containing protein [Clostridia bacterium]MBQ1555560.1 DUF4870 domain-containing protein [Clostridia bacterium]